MKVANGRGQRFFAPPIAATVAPVPTAPVPDWLTQLAQLALGGAAIATGLYAIGRLTETTRQKHDRKVLEVARRHVREGADVYADLPGWRKPPTMNHHIADVVAVRGTTIDVIEVEHPHTLDTSHTRRQLHALDKYCAKRRRCFFDIELT